MLRRALVLAIVLSGAALGAADIDPAPVATTHLLHIPGCSATVELPVGWELANAVAGALVVLQGPPEHSMPLGEALAARPMIAITVQVLDPGQDPLSLMVRARDQCQRLLAHFSVLSATEPSRTLSGRTWQYLHYSFELAQQSCDQELYISQSQGVAIYVVCSCAPSRASAYEPLFARTVASMNSSGTPSLGEPLGATR
jgi:hypothetical protein